MARGKAFRSAIERGKAKAIKKLTFGADKSAGRNSQGRITIFHRGGGAKRLQRVIDFKRETPSTGVVERIEYDPNRSSKIALVRWLTGHNHFSQQKQPQGKGFHTPEEILRTKAKVGTVFSFSTFNNIMPSKPSAIPLRVSTFSPRVLPRVALAGAKTAFFAPLMNETEKLEFSVCDVRRSVGMGPKPELSFSREGKINCNPNPKKKKLKLKVKVKVDEEKGKAFRADRAVVSYILAGRELEAGKTVMNCGQGGLEAALEINDNSDMSSGHYALDPQNQAGNCIALADMRLGTWVHSIEMSPGKGPQLTRAAGTFAKILKKNAEDGQCVVRLPSGAEKVLDWRCRATIGMVSNPNHGARKLVKAGQSRWLGRRPVVRGVAMNPIDHPHGGGEGRTKGGRPSVSPWGKPTKGGYKTRSPKKKT